uniref:Deleted in malignant brain tumors 1 protein-like n=1 Tax=Geotrypetes seraphini TaxID=260995 RepID=A0A6P8R1H0_GEOSA|nr:deleted in malignant brain tumors 1 protein-like [Geotrypetes seraphini]
MNSLMRTFPVWSLVILCTGGSWGLSGPKEVRGHPGGSLSLQCQYKERYKTSKKYWCKRETWSSCEILIQTKSNSIMTKDRLSIRDNSTALTFTVTMESLTKADSGTYWCGIDKYFSDIGYPVIVTVLTGSISQVRLLGGSHSCNGTVEVYYNNTWGTICDHEWDIHDAAVVCRQVGCGPAIEATVEASNGADSGPVWLDNCFCRGLEADLSLCGSHILLQNHRCNSIGRAGVRCSSSGFSGVRLVDGDGSCAGRVEVKYINTWGTICDYKWDLADATVVCRELGCGSAVNASHGTYFQPGSGPVWLKAVYCRGNETRFSQCGSVMAERYPCDHRWEAGVICLGQERVWTSVVFRFMSYTLAFASIFMGFFLYSYLKDNKKQDTHPSAL